MPEESKKENINKQAKQAFVYLGSNIPGGILFTGGVYKEIPAHLERLFEKIPEIRQLFIEIQEVSAFKAELSHQGSEAFYLKQTADRLINELISKGGMKNVI